MIGHFCRRTPKVAAASSLDTDDRITCQMNWNLNFSHRGHRTLRKVGEEGLEPPASRM